MKVIICGAGQVGGQIARHLAGERNDVTLIDIDEALVRHSAEALDVEESRASPATRRAGTTGRAGLRPHHRATLGRGEYGP